MTRISSPIVFKRSVLNIHSVESAIFDNLIDIEISPRFQKITQAVKFLPLLFYVAFLLVSVLDDWHLEHLLLFHLHKVILLGFQHLLLKVALLH